MENIINIATQTQQIETLENEVKRFADELPYWAKFLAEKVLSGNNISENDIDISYSFLLEELKLKDETVKPKIEINFNDSDISDYKSDLLLARIENVEGVNALVENQIIEFNPNLTIIYGTNGSGKSGYVRLMKDVFYSKVKEVILSNVHTNVNKAIDAKFTFKSNNTEISLTHVEKTRNEFQQFAVFDGKGLFQQLAGRNEFEFRPAGLTFFAEYTNAINRVEQKLNIEISNKQTSNDFAIWFDGESEIKTFVQGLNAKTKIEDLKKYTPFSDENANKKTELQKQYDELLLISKGKEREIAKLENIKRLLNDNKQTLEELNRAFTTESLLKVKETIIDYNNKQATAKAEGIESFKTDKIEGIGTAEWKNFITAAEVFAKKQKIAYPSNGDNCILCQQPLSLDAEKLIANYWIFIKSVAEGNAKQAQDKLDKAKQFYDNLKFDIFSDNDILTTWLKEKYPNELDLLRKKLTELKTFSQTIVSDIQTKTGNERKMLSISLEQHNSIEIEIVTKISSLKNDEQSKQLEELRKEKTLLEHKEKFNSHFSKFELYINNQIWVEKAKKSNFAKCKITDTEKVLSDKYFNQKYINTFNDECQKLNGNFGINIDCKGNAGKSNRQLKLKGKSPNDILSEGEQKVIAIADFLSEMQLSEVNRGLIFDDPVNSLDEKRKDVIAKRLVELSDTKQSIVFTHDLVFVYALISHCTELNRNNTCHWIENRDSIPGYVWLNNSPSYEKEYRNANPVKKHYDEAKKTDCSPMQREYFVKAGFTALRTCYEVLVINDLFCNVVQRFSERVSVDSLSSVYFDSAIINELQESFGQCCRYMEGHSHSDKFAYQKPELNNLNDEIQRYEAIKKKIKDIKKTQ
jgi:energy-coupling factor transporter ATP-binding protein EcfA2